MHSSSVAISLLQLAMLPILASAVPTAQETDWSLPSNIRQDPMYGAPANDFACKSSRNPVVLLHGLGASADFGLNLLQRDLNARGYCTFSITYGKHPLVPWLGGVQAVEDSAKEITSFIKEVRDKTGASKVDLVGHSEGGFQTIYVTQTQTGAADMVERAIALGPSIHGATYFGLTDLWYIGGEETRALVSQALKLWGCAACDDLAVGGAAVKKLAEGPMVKSGVRATIIASNADALVKPETSWIKEAGVRNVLVQDVCPNDGVGHLGLTTDQNVWNLVINALEDTPDRTFSCSVDFLPV